MKYKNKIDHLYTYKQVKKKGKIDGRGFIWKFWPFVKDVREVRPPIEQQGQAQYELELFGIGKTDLNNLSKEWEEEDKELKTKYCLAKNSREKAKINLSKEDKEAIEAGSIFEDVSKNIHELGFPSLSQGWMIFWLVFFGLAEIPLNYIVFQTLAESYWLTMMLALGLCAAIPYIAHHFGKALKQENKTYTEKVIIIFIPVLIIALLGVIALLRTSYFVAVQSNIKWLHLTISPSTLTVLFIVINLTIFFVAVLVSYQGSHENHKIFKILKKRYKDTKRSFEKESGEANVAAKQYSKADDEYQRARAHREGCHKEYCRTAELIRSKTKAYMEIYRTANLENRTKAEKPECFKVSIDELPKDEPKNLKESSLNWDCSNDEKKTNNTLN